MTLPLPSGRIFGTDGIRGQAGLPPLDPATVWAVGKVLGEQYAPGDPLLVAMDTRASGPTLVTQLTQGLGENGIRVRFAGVLPTPAVAFLIPHEGFAGGVMLTASHNPFSDNGIKIFDSHGKKLSDKREKELEAAIRLCREKAPQTFGHMPNPIPGTLADTYLGSIRKNLPCQLEGLQVVVDGANGAGCHFLPRLLADSGATVRTIGDSPDGMNINQECGATAMNALIHEVTARHMDLGVSLDGDGDRCLAVDSKGRILDGDHALFHFARYLEGRQFLIPHQPVVGTVMSNLWLEKAMEHTHPLLRAAVGDRYVWETMEQQNLPLGGEQSGHMILRPFQWTGDGLFSALLWSHLAQEAGGSIPLREDLDPWPQVLINHPVTRKPNLDHEPYSTLIKDFDSTIQKWGGRMVVRYSGTENLLRVMVEGQEKDGANTQAKEFAEKLALVIEEH